MAAFAPVEIRGSAFGLLATVQAIGKVAVGSIAGLLYTVASPTVAFVYLAALILLALAILGWVEARDRLLGSSGPGLASTIDYVRLRPGQEGPGLPERAMSTARKLGTVDRPRRGG
ncbi:hypothetical protein GCM10010464_40900 [Pseudonocardia yunnanensis]